MYPRRRAAAILLMIGFVAQAAYPSSPVSTDGEQEQTESAPAILRMRVLEGEGAIHTAGTRSNQPMVVVVTDETGRPVEGASVSMRLPDEAPTGLFPNGMRTEIAVTGPDGRVAIRGIQWARVAGPAQVRITANKGEARAGILSTQYITEPAGAQARRAGAESAKAPARAPARLEAPSRSKWILVAALIGGAAAGGVAAAARGGSTAPGTPVAAAPPAVTQPATTIGVPMITIGRP